MGVLGEFKRGVDVAHGDWFGVREGTHLLGVHPLHPYVYKSPPPPPVKKHPPPHYIYSSPPPPYHH
ncbi:hypothetical protein Hanom_Chr05g00471511 [Helianthus anomalus]